MQNRNRDKSVAITKKQTTRLLRVVCPNCGARLRATRRFLAEGRPTCPCGYAMQVIDSNPLARDLTDTTATETAQGVKR
jgi:tRNA(Ile2) C34 agmatinyltransferase TiaS